MTRKKKSAKETLKILVLKKKMRIVLLKAHKQQETKQSQEGKENRWITWKVNSRRSNHPPLMENLGWVKRIKHGYYI
jgi:hypothetical protein